MASSAFCWCHLKLKSHGQRRDLNKDSLGPGMSRGCLGRITEVMGEVEAVNLGQPEALQAAVSSFASRGDSCLQGTDVAQRASGPYSVLGKHGNKWCSLHGAGNIQGNMWNAKKAKIP